jgi:hypothetical protein
MKNDLTPHATCRGSGPSSSGKQHKNIIIELLNMLTTLYYISTLH